MRLGNTNKNTLVQKLDVRSKGKGKGFTFNMSLQIPALEGVIDAAEIGALAVAEFIDLVRKTWERGQVLPYRNRKMTVTMKKRRLLWNSLLRDMPTDKKSFNQMIKPIKSQMLALVKDQGDIDEIYSYMYNLDRLDYLRTHYTMRKQIQKRITGIQKAKFETGMHPPNPDSSKAVDDSGIMSASLHGRFRKSSKYFNKDTKRMVHSAAQLILSVAKHRQRAAIRAGLSSDNNSFFTNMMNVNKRDFKHTNDLLAHGIYWADKRRNITRILTAAKIIYRVASFAARI